MKRKHTILNALEMFVPGFIPPGLWSYPGDESFGYLSTDLWIKLAKLLERGRFDSVFFADIIGNLDVYGGNMDAALRSGVATPGNDPMVLISAMAHTTEHLGFGVTGNALYESAYLFARRMSTLDHLTKGRIGWNVVTGYVDSAARAMGLDRQLPHDQRYEAAQEFIEVTYKLWEQSWQDGAVLRDRANRIYADPSKVHKIAHQGRHIQMEAVHRCEPSPQRTPVIYQAGSSPKGRRFAARHAECVYIPMRSKTFTRQMISEMREMAAEYGRNPHDIKFVGEVLVSAGETHRDAEKHLALLQHHLAPEGTLAMMGGAMGIDFAQGGLDTPIGGARETQSSRSVAKLLVEAEQEYTPRKMSEHLLQGTGAILVGTADEIADEMESWIDDTDVDGFNIAPGFRFETMERFVDLVVPELQRRDVVQKEYAEGTLREKLFGGEIPATHPRLASAGG